MLVWGVLRSSLSVSVTTGWQFVSAFFAALVFSLLLSSNASANVFFGDCDPAETQMITMTPNQGLIFLVSHTAPTGRSPLVTFLIRNAVFVGTGSVMGDVNRSVNVNSGDTYRLPVRVGATGGSVTIICDDTSGGGVTPPTPGGGVTSQDAAKQIDATLPATNPEVIDGDVFKSFGIGLSPNIFDRVLGDNLPQGDPAPQNGNDPPVQLIRDNNNVGEGQSRPVVEDNGFNDIRDDDDPAHDDTDDNQDTTPTPPSRACEDCKDGLLALNAKLSRLNAKLAELQALLKIKEAERDKVSEEVTALEGQVAALKAELRLQISQLDETVERLNLLQPDEFRPEAEAFVDNLLKTKEVDFMDGALNPNASYEDVAISTVQHSQSRLRIFTSINERAQEQAEIVNKLSAQYGGKALDDKIRETFGKNTTYDGVEIGSYDDYIGYAKEMQRVIDVNKDNIVRATKALVDRRIKEKRDARIEVIARERPEVGKQLNDVKEAEKKLAEAEAALAKKNEERDAITSEINTAEFADPTRISSLDRFVNDEGIVLDIFDIQDEIKKVGEEIAQKQKECDEKCGKLTNDNITLEEGPVFEPDLGLGENSADGNGDEGPPSNFEAPTPITVQGQDDEVQHNDPDSYKLPLGARPAIYAYSAAASNNTNASRAIDGVTNISRASRHSRPQGVTVNGSDRHVNARFDLREWRNARASYGARLDTAHGFSGDGSLINDPRFNFFASASVSFGENDNGGVGQDSTAYSVSAGISYLVRPNLNVGIAARFGEADIDSNISDIDTSTWGIAVFAQTQIENLNLEAIAAWSRSDIDSLFNNAGVITTTDTVNTAFSAQVKASTQIRHNNLVLSPNASVTYVETDRDAFALSDGQIAPGTGDDIWLYSVGVGIGVDPFEHGDYLITPGFGLGLAGEFDDGSDVNLSASANLGIKDRNGVSGSVGVGYSGFNGDASNLSFSGSITIPLN
ncbi:MAG: autotransporter domain-containing protein [Pseudomonadota bacterium]